MGNIKKLLFYFSSFSGKAGRLEYSIYFLINILSWNLIFYLYNNTNWNDDTLIYIFYIYLILLLKLIPIKAAATRRLRDLNQNTGLIFITFIPIINIVFEIALLFIKGKNNFTDRKKLEKIGCE
jgi:uncharacterized membrane protein YhaH (DUF805 family)